jgi:cytoskeleton protein RodZ
MSQDAATAVAEAVDRTVPDPLPATPPSVGEFLRQERVRQGLAIGDVAQRLKYAPRQIEAVEADDFKALPGLTFVRGFVRGYARLLAIDGDRLVAMLERAAEVEGGPTTVQLQSVSSNRAPLPVSSGSNSSAWPWLLAIFLVVACIGGYSIYYWEAPSALKKASEPVRPILTEPRVPAGGLAAAAPAPDGTQAVNPSLAGVPGTEGQGSIASGTAPLTAVDAIASTSSPTFGDKPSFVSATEATPAQPATQGKIRLVFAGESWTEIKEAGGKVVFSRRNPAGSEQWVDGTPPFDVVVGNARDVKVFYRGSEIDLVPSTKVSVARLQLR